MKCILLARGCVYVYISQSYTGVGIYNLVGFLLFCSVWPSPPFVLENWIFGTRVSVGDRRQLCQCGSITFRECCPSRNKLLSGDFIWVAWLHTAVHIFIYIYTHIVEYINHFFFYSFLLDFIIFTRRASGGQFRHGVGKAIGKKKEEKDKTNTTKKRIGMQGIANVK